ncbi:hypothetical protein [uncultured Gammaproteobacteria bacterium]|nr:hypothetical protein [uncultured Gammaproteobacteria bacterium]
MRLKDIATIKTGLVLSRKKAARYDVQKKYQKITLKSFSNSTQINPNSLDEFVSNSEVKQEYLTQTNDIIIRLRAPNIALYVDKNAQGLVISSLMSVIRLNDKNINSRFLAYYLNSKQSQKIFNIAVKGTTIPMIRTGDIAELDISLLPLSTQRKVIKTMDLLYKEQALLTELTKKKQIFTQNILDTITKQFQGEK